MIAFDVDPHFRNYDDTSNRFDNEFFKYVNLDDNYHQPSQQKSDSE